MGVRRFFIAIFIGFLAISCATEPKKEQTQLSGNVFGTTYHITYASTVNYQKSIDSLFNLVNRSLSTYIPTSDISKINKGDTTVVVDHFFKEVFQKSARIFKETEGYFDPTVGQLVNAWGFGPKKEKANLDSLQVQTIMQTVGFEKVKLINNHIQKKDPKIFLDFNSIAKGYGIDVIGRFLAQQGISSYLVEIGGEIRTKGTKINGKKWRVAVEKPNVDGTQSFQKVIELADQSMATSGNYRKYRLTADGKKYVHIVNPLTGFATESNLLSASVIGNTDCADVDAYATAFMAMGLERTKTFVNAHPELKVILIYVNDQGELQEFISQ